MDRPLTAMTDLPELCASDPVPELDPVAARRWRQQHRLASPWLHEEAGRRMASRLQWIKLQPQHWASWSPLLGGLHAHQSVAARYPEATCHLLGEQIDQARTLLGRAARPSGWRRWWNRWAGQPPVVEAPPAPFDLLWANMALHLHDRPGQVLRQWHAALRTNGILLFSCLGPDTLREIRQVYAASGWLPPAHGMTDMHDWGDMLVASGFAEPVMDVERLTLTYTRLQALLDDLRAWGRNLHTARSAATWSRGQHLRWMEVMQAGLPRTPDGQFSLTVELIYGYAIKPTPQPKVGLTTAVSLDDMKALLRKTSTGSRRAGA